MSRHVPHDEWVETAAGGAAHALIVAKLVERADFQKAAEIVAEEIGVLLAMECWPMLPELKTS